jgi:multidrug efflux pump subunit AcrA (membrane-fusion protein)
MLFRSLSPFLCGAFFAAACSGPPPAVVGAGATGSSTSEDLAVTRRGPFERRVLITGDLVAAEAVSLVVPQSTSWQVEVRWLAEDGTLLAAGDRAAELDNSAILDQLEEKEIALDQSLIELEGEEAQAAVDLAEKRFAVEDKKSALAKAELDAEVPADLVSRREHEEKLLALAKARLDLEKAEEDLRSSEAARRADLEVRRVEIAKSRREIDAAHRSIAALTLLSPVAGVWVVGNHPWEGRKIQVGDNVFVGLTVGTVPNLSSVVVEARLPDVDDGTVAPGMAARVVLDAYPERVFPGRVREVTGIAQELATEATRRFFKVVVALDEADPERMIPGMSARVEVLAEARPDALLVSRSALRRSPEGIFVRLAEGERPVTLGPCSELDCVVESGLEAGGSP